MLGTEYNWLITLSEPRDGTRQVRLASTALLTLAVAVFCVLCISLRAQPASELAADRPDFSATSQHNS